MTDLIYIMGAGRSGSTLLERLLGSAPGITALGEVHSLWRMPLRDLTCSCGAPGPECSFWADVRQLAGLTSARLQALAELEHDSIRHIRILRAGFSLSRFHTDRRVACFLAMQRDLFAAAIEVSGATTLIDSSKAAPRAWALTGLPDTRLLHLTRDYRAVAASWKKQKNDPSLGGPMQQMSALASGAVQARAALSAKLLSRQHPVSALRYEQLVADPRSALAACGLSDVVDRIAWLGQSSFAADPNYHTLNGNPDRFARGEIAIQPATPSIFPDRLAS